MIAGKLIGGGIIGSALIFGAVVYYMQIYHYYSEVETAPTGDVVLTAQGGDLQQIAYTGLTAIDAESSPIRYRACFSTDQSLDSYSASYEPYDGGIPKNAPDWFDCFDAAAIGAEIEAGTARVFTGQRNFEWGIDRVVAITDDGRGYVWHEINSCGDKAYDGSPLGKDCPPRDGEN